MEAVGVFFENLGNWVWGSYLLVLLVGTGIYLTVRLAGLQFSLLPYALKQVVCGHKSGEQQGDISHFAALMTALSATIGTGNIAGVATAVVLGGPGAVFWMWITAVFGMATKYAEAVLAVKYRIQDERGEMAGGPMYYIERGMGNKPLAVAFALFAVLASFGIGSSVQSNSVADVLAASFNVEGWKTGLALTVLTGMVIIGGIKSIARAASIIVPFMAFFYVTGGLYILISHWHLLGEAFALILGDAFTGQAAAGGAIGVVIRYGVARGIFSNEAGLGSAPIAAAAAKTDHPVRQALVSMTGTFIDTIVVCSITGLVLVIGQLLHPDIVGTGAALTTRSFNALLPHVGGWIVSFGIVFFAYSTILGWCYYGEKCAVYLWGVKTVPYYRLAYVAAVMTGSVVGLEAVWAASDAFNGLMAVPNLIALLVLTKVVVLETRDFQHKRATGILQ